MREIVVISGKGGTGKTSLSAAFAHLMQNGIVCDLDVDTPDLHILLEPKVRTEHMFVSGLEARIHQAVCTQCGLCMDACRFDAIGGDPNGLFVDPLRCEGCGVCSVVCPSGAVVLSHKHCGQWYESDTRFGPMIHAQLSPGEENSGRLVSLLKQKAREEAGKDNLETILCDGSPGIGCPVISSLSGAHMAVLVVEPTPSGRHDFLRVADLCQHFRIPVNVVINKSDLNHEECEAIMYFCGERGYAVAGTLPFSPDVVSAMISKQVLTETRSPLAGTIATIWRNILSNTDVCLRERKVS